MNPDNQNPEEKPSAKKTAMTPAEQCVSSFLNDQYEELCRDRYPEEREWFESGLFYQLRQWLERDPQTNRIRPMKQGDGKNGKKPWPMPVSNYFSQTIDLNSNSLGAAIPSMTAQAENYDAANRRAAEAAERAIDEANRESGFNILNPRLAQHVAMFGIGWTKDYIQATQGSEEIPTLQPQAGQDGEEQLVPGEATQIPAIKIKTDVLSPFEIYTLRDYNPNDSPQYIEHRSLETGRLKAQYPDFAEHITPGGKAEGDLALYYLRTLRRLMAGSANLEDEKNKTVTKTGWLEWTRLPDDCREAIEKEWENQPSDAYQKEGLTKLQAAQAYGLFAVFACGLCLEMAENPNKGKKPYTAFLWKEDPASPYPIGLGVTLKPLQKQLNRLDSLIEKSLMANSAGKWIVPIDETRTDLTSDPNDVVMFDPDSAKPPQFVSTNPIAAACFQRRQTIVQEFQALGYTTSLDTGDIPASAPFRALAFAGSKQDESRKTQRFLWEQSHELRARKLIELAKRAWIEPRKVKAAGYNNRIGFTELESADLQGDYEVSVVADSSRPKTLTEKTQAVATLIQGGLVDPHDPDVREYILDTMGETELDLIDHLSYVKAERDLEMLKQGTGPAETPYMHWDIEFRVISEYTLTEEFESLDPNIRAQILLWCQYCQFHLQQAVPQPPPQGPHPAGKALAGPTPGNVMHGIPGAQFSPQQVQAAANSEANQFVQGMQSEQGAGA